MRICTTILLAAFAGQITAQSLCFDPESDSRYSTGNGPTAVAYADFDNDGKKDVAVANYLDANVSVLKGNGNGTFNPQQTYSINSTGPEAIGAADFNNDGRPDIVTFNRNPSSLSLLVNNGSGGFNAPLTFNYIPYFTATHEMRLADVTGDNREDLILNNFTGNSLLVLKNNGNSTFTPLDTLLTLTKPNQLAVGDLNNDGAADIAVAYDGSVTANDSVSYFINAGNGTYNNRTSMYLITFPVGERDLAIADVDGDNDGDILVEAVADLQLFKNGGGLNFTLQPSIAIAGYASEIFTGFFNADGVRDLVVAVESDGIKSLMGNGNGTYRPYNAYSAYGEPRSACLADFDNDGRADIIACNYTQDNIAFAKGQTDGSFGPFELRAGAAASGIALGNFNNDTLPDLITANYNATNAAILLSNANGTFQPTQFDSCVTAKEVVVADFNGDLKMDAAIIGNGQANFLQGDGAGNFSLVANFNTGFATGGDFFAVAGDFNHDNKADLAISHNNSDSISVLLGNGNFTLQASVKYFSGNMPQELAAGYLNTDNNLDLVVTNYDDNTVSVLAGNANGTFQTAIVKSTGANPSRIALADLNGDGKQDITVLNSNADNIGILLNSGSLNFQAQSTYSFSASQGPTDIAVAKITADTIYDLLVTLSIGDKVALFVGNGNGTFQSPVYYTVDNSPEEVVSADFNHDGANDIATVNSRSGNVTVILNNNAFVQALGSTTICQGDSLQLQASGGFTYLWSTGQSSATIWVSQAGTYTASVTNQSNTCTLVPPSLVVTTSGSVPVVSYTLLNTDHYCISDGILNLANTGGSPQGGTFSGANVSNGVLSLTAAGAGLHLITYSYTDPGGCGTGSAVDTVFIDTEVLAAISLPSDTFCEASAPVNLTAYGQPSGGVWVVDNANDTMFDPQSFGAGSGTIIHYVTFNNACKDTATATLYVVNAVNASYNLHDTVCINGGAEMLTGGSPSGGYYLGAGVAGNAMFSPDVAGVGDHNITYIYNLFGCSDTAYSMITVAPKPSSALTLPFDTICSLDAPISLSGGSPAGGTYVGEGVQGGLLQPSQLTPGLHVIGYSTINEQGCNDTATAQIVVEGCTGVNEPQSALFAIWPNPAAGYVNIKLSEHAGATQIQVFEQSGRLLFSEELSSSSTQLQLPYPAGVYLLKITASGTNYCHNLMLY